MRTYDYLHVAYTGKHSGQQIINIHASTKTRLVDILFIRLSRIVLAVIYFVETRMRVYVRYYMLRSDNAHLSRWPVIAICFVKKLTVNKAKAMGLIRSNACLNI